MTNANLSIEQLLYFERLCGEIRARIRLHEKNVNEARKRF